MTTEKQIQTNSENAKSGGVKTEENKTAVKKLTEIEVRDLVKKRFKAECDPELIFKTAREKFESLKDIKREEFKEPKEELQKFVYNSLMPLGLETHYPLAETVKDSYRPLVIEVARQIEKEYDCRTPSEKILAETIAGAHIRIINYSRKLNALTDEGYLTAERNGYGNMLSKEIDRAQRHLISALVILKEVKNPTIELNVKAKTAFVAQNQQINAVNNPILQNENINPK